MTEWKVTAQRASRAQPLPALAEYRATVRANVERSEIALAPNVGREFLRRALSMEPYPVPTWWVAPADDSDGELTRAAVARFRALFEFGSILPIGPSDFLAGTLAARLEGQVMPIAALKRYLIDAQILQDGSSVWGYSVPKAGQYHELLGADSERYNVLASGPLDDFLQASAQVDLTRRFEAMHA